MAVAHAHEETSTLDHTSDIAGFLTTRRAKITPEQAPAPRQLDATPDVAGVGAERSPGSR